MMLAKLIRIDHYFIRGRTITGIELKSESDLAKAYQGRYEGFNINLRRISNEVKARRGEYEGFGTYLRRISNEVKAGRDDH
jgi:hypothetical protein